jgi:hypothetical protein
LDMTADVFGGLPRSCYRTTLDGCFSYRESLDVSRRSTWCLVGNLIFQLYIQAAFIEEFLRANVPGIDEVIIDDDPDNSPPQYIMWKGSCGRGMVLAGTTNFQQAALQAFYGSQGPTGVGRFYTSRFWWDQAMEVKAIFEDFAGPHRKHTFLAGHSYGGAVAGLIGANETTVTNRDDYSLLTLGAPRFGNGQVYRYLSPTESVFLQNVGDPVPSFPPSYPSLSDLQAILGSFSYFMIQRWAPPPMQTVLRADGSYYVSNAWNGGDVTAAAMAEVIRDRSLFPTFELHKVQYYTARSCDT